MSRRVTVEEKFEGALTVSRIQAFLAVQELPAEATVYTYHSSRDDVSSITATWEVQA